MKLSIIIPVYNEEKTIEKVLKRVIDADLSVNKEIIIVDDGSVDSSKDKIERFIKKNKDKKVSFVFRSKKNEGKGSAIKEGVKLCTGNIITIQDADLEYDPREYKILLDAMSLRNERVVYGSRFLLPHEPLYRLYFWGNKFLSLLTKILYNAQITDMETCYKMFKSDVIKSIHLKANGFDIEPEMTARILKKGITICEIPISYSPRRVEEGKKIGWRDGIVAIYTLIYWRIFSK